MHDQCNCLENNFKCTTIILSNKEIVGMPVQTMDQLSTVSNFVHTPNQINNLPICNSPLHQVVTPLSSPVSSFKLSLMEDLSLAPDGKQRDWSPLWLATIADYLRHYADKDFREMGVGQHKQQPDYIHFIPSIIHSIKEEREFILVTLYFLCKNTQ